MLPGSETPVEERREIVRVPCKIPAVCRHAGGEQMKVVVVDMGMRGLRLETDKKLAKDSAVAILRPGGGPIACKVVWTRPKRFSEKHLSGLQFSDTSANMKASWIKGTLQQLGFEPGRIKEKRKHIRVPSEQRATLVSTAGDELTEGIILNLGLGGALVQMQVQVPSQVKVSLRVDPVGVVAPLEMPCQIRSSWKDERTLKFMHGLRFDDQNNDLVKKHLKILMKSA